MSATADYWLTLASSTGDALGMLAWSEIAYSLVAGDVSELEIVLAHGVSLPSSAIPDGLIEVWRRPVGADARVEGPYRWLIQSVETRLSAAGLITTTVGATSPLWLLQEPGRFVDAYAETAGAAKTAAADDMIKAIVREQAGALASAARQIPGLVVTADTAAAPSMSKAFAWKPALQTIQEIARTSTEGGVYLTFDLTNEDGGALRFDTYTQCRGIDRRSPGGDAPRVFGSAYGNLAETTLRIDYADEVTFCKAGGQGDGSGRLTDTAQDDSRIVVSPYRRRETFKDATSYSSVAGLSDEAASVVRGGRPRLVFSGEVQDTPTSQYGVHWGFGDLVTVQEFGYILDARIDAVSVKVDAQRETVRAVLRTETYL
jgi:hypothetical protein